MKVVSSRRRMRLQSTTVTTVLNLESQLHMAQCFASWDFSLQALKIPGSFHESRLQSELHQTRMKKRLSSNTFSIRISLGNCVRVLLLMKAGLEL
jgi:hypothetical protein